MPSDAVFVHHPEAMHYRFNDQHPFNPQRLKLAIDLLHNVSALERSHMQVPPPASDELLRLVHRDDYIEAVQALSTEQPSSSWLAKAAAYGLQTEDTPFFPGMHRASAALVGGSVHAAELVASGRARHAFHMGGGLHHAFPERGAGFCVYNDAAVAIAHIRSRYKLRVLYIDTDVHHGDGVQFAFYHDPDVCTYSIHETGKFLFPGTGFVQEKGGHEGFGACYNIPLDPYTEDDSWLECFSASIEKVAAAFKPDLIISQHGCDAHAYDPLSHVHCSMRIYEEMPARIHRLAHRYADGRWVAIGGGGYDIWRVVPRAWAMVWLTMIEHPLVAQLGAGPQTLPRQWMERWQPESPVELPTHWLDDTSSWAPMPRRDEIAHSNRSTAAIAVQDL
ncbi:acetoin utilization protein AcuC [Paenibacillus sp. IB182496]|uniref:Acetoin utilization protein AcuC n=1 Tax=Paenibacillus sabuli TaxID=2772509 RepID=A0A927BVD9_9BACL|nr:acetoin utilization protein AcuC [Paenibacillus sabuli]MBD2846214.1 acetoin utilization protein AcuC [Paenibacillus sabuli]